MSLLLLRVALMDVQVCVRACTAVCTIAFFTLWMLHAYVTISLSLSPSVLAVRPYFFCIRFGRLVQTQSGSSWVLISLSATKGEKRNKKGGRGGGVCQLHKKVKSASAIMRLILSCFSLFWSQCLFPLSIQKNRQWHQEMEAEAPQLSLACFGFICLIIISRLSVCLPVL